MRTVLLSLCLLPLMAAPAPAACRCACVQGEMRAICLPTDLVTPICQGICTDAIRPAPVVRPLAGGDRPATEPVRPFDPANGGVGGGVGSLDLDARGLPLGTAGVSGGNDALSGAGRR